MTVGLTILTFILISRDNWERFLLRLLNIYWVNLEQYPCPLQVLSVSEEGDELLENLTFNELKLGDKIEIINALCDYRLWCDDAADALRDFPLEEIRLESIGKDTQGYEYWYFSGTRLFKAKRELIDEQILREQQISKLGYKLVELKKCRILKEREEKEKEKEERAKLEALKEKEKLNALKKREEQEAKRKKQSKIVQSLPPRTGLRERRSSTLSNTNTNDTKSVSTPQRQTRQSNPPPKVTRSTVRSDNSKQKTQATKPEPPKLDTESDIIDEIEKLQVSLDERKAAWSIACESLEEWEEFSTRFNNTKSTNERYLSSHLNQEILPKIRNIYNKKIAEARKKEKELIFSLASRRTSSRITCRRAQEEEEEKKAQLIEEELRRKKIEAEARLKAELEREVRQRKNKTLFDEERVENNGEEARYSLRTQPSYEQPSYEYDGIIHPDKMVEFYEAIELGGYFSSLLLILGNETHNSKLTTIIDYKFF